MPAPASAHVVIECPHCGTRYQVTQAAIGAKGRSVQCAHCGKSWDAKALPPSKPELKPVAKPVPAKPSDELGDDVERALDAEFTREERPHSGKDAAVGPGAAQPRSDEHQRTLDEIKSAIAPKAPIEKLDPATRKLRLLEFARRQAHLSNTLPMAKMRRTARIAVFLSLICTIGGALVFRSPLVQQFPQLAGVYAAVGLGVNVIGLEFGDVHTLKSLQQGAEVLVVDGDIRNVAGRQVDVPQVIVTLLGADGAAAYEWSVAPKASQLGSGEMVHFETQFTAPPAGAQRVRLTFANGRSQSRTTDQGVDMAPADAPTLGGIPPTAPGES